MLGTEIAIVIEIDIVFLPRRRYDAKIEIAIVIDIAIEIAIEIVIAIDFLSVKRLTS